MSDQKIYTHDSDMDCNLIVYCFMRSIHLPILEGQELPLQDTWFAVPAVQHGPMVSLMNLEVEMTALQMIDQNGRVVKAHRVNPNIAPILSQFEIDQIKREAFDIPLWEQTNQKKFPYDSMFDKAKMKQIFDTTGQTAASLMTIESSNITYQTIRKKIQPRPCTTCGGKKR
uniref:Uncharacterized protein n=1 Tax=Pseudomonas phage HRDY3 TaxID=3236930 RepID=A0AB39CE51_9VIRU